MPFSAALTNGAVTLDWQRPDIDMSDTLVPVNIFRRTDGPEPVGQLPTDWTGWTMIAGSVNSPWTDNVGPAPSFVTPGVSPVPAWYKMEDRTGNGVFIPHKEPFVTNVASGSALWAHIFGGTAINPVKAQASADVMDIDRRDNSVLTAGHFWADLNFEGTNPLFSNGNYPKTVLVKYSQGGAIISPLPVMIGKDVPNFIKGIAVDPSGNIFLAGYFSLGPTSLRGPDLPYSGATDLMFGKLDPIFNHIWSRSIGGFGSDICGGCCIDSAGHLWMTGSQQGSVDFGNGFTLTGGAFLAKFDKTDGHTIWAGNIPGNIGTSIAADLVNNYIGVACDFNINVSKFDLNGALQWNHSYGNGNDSIQAIAFDNSGNLLFGAQFYGTKSFGGQTWTAGTGSSTIVVKLSASGAHIWDQAYALDSLNYPWIVTSIKVDLSSAVLIGGHAIESEIIEGQFLPTQGFWSPIVLKYSALTTTPTFAWVKRTQGASDNFLNAMAIDNTLKIGMGGSFGYSIDFGAIQKQTSGNGGSAGFTAQLQP